jgi:hypothetical protein
VSQAALLLSLWLVLRTLGGGTAALTAVLVVWILGGTVQENLVLGQVNPFLLLAVALAGWLLPRRPGTAAAVLGAAAALKVWPAVLLLVFVRRRAWRPLAAGVAVAVALVLAPAAITAALVDEAAPLVRDAGVRVGTAAPLNVSLPALALRLADPPPGAELPASWLAGTSPAGFEPLARHGWLAAVVAAAVLIASAVALGARANGRRPAADPPLPSDLPGERHRYQLELAALTAAAILAAPIGWYHYQLCQFPAFALVIERVVAQRRFRAALVAIAVLAALTRAQAWGFGRYVERWGWTAEAPAVLWLVTSIVPVLGALWTWYLVRAARVSPA